MTTVLQYLVIAAVIGGIVFALAVFVFGRGEQMAALSPRTSPTELPDTGMTGQDVRSVRFAMALRGYRMSEVDWALERMAGELDTLRAQLAARPVVPVGVGVDELADRRTAGTPGQVADPPAGSVPGPSGAGDRE